MCILRRNTRCVRIPRGFIGCKMLLLPTALALLIRLSLLALPVTSQHCQLNRARAQPDQQPLDPSIPSPSISNATSTSPTQPKPSSTPFVYGRDKVRGVNLYVVFRRFHPLLILPSPLEVVGSCLRYLHFSYRVSATMVYSMGYSHG